MPQKPSNPFHADPPEAKSITLTFRVTPTEHQAIIDAVGTQRGAIAQLIREGLALALDRSGGK